METNVCEKKASYLDRLDTFAQETISNPKKLSQLLENAGITTNSGKFTKQYKELDNLCVSVSK